MEIFFVLILFLNSEIYKVHGAECKTNICLHNGKCTNPPGKDKNECSCQDGYSGDICDIEPTTETSATTLTLSTTQALASLSTSTVYTTQTPTSTVYTTQASTSTVYTTQASASTVYTTQTSASTVYTTQTSASTVYTPQISATTAYETQTSESTVYTPQISASTVYILQTSTATTSKLTSTVGTSSYSTSAKSNESLFPSPTGTANKRFQGDQTTVVVSVTIPVVVVVICAVILGVCFIRRWKRKKGLGTTAFERAPGISISNTSYGDHQVYIPKAANGDVPDGSNNEYAEIAVNKNPANEQPDGYYTIDDVPKIFHTYNTNYAHVNTHKASMLDSNYSHIGNNNKKVSKTGDYGFSKFKRGIFQLKKSSKKYTDSSYDNLEMKTVAYNPNKNVEDVAMTELESEYNHTQAGVPKSTKKDIQNEKDEYSHLDHKPKSVKTHANEVATENPYRRGQSQQTSEFLANLHANEYENAVGIRHDYFVLEPVGESEDHSIEESDMSKFEERNSISASGFQYEYAREVERSETHKNEETRDIKSACHYELSKDIDTNPDIANEPADIDDCVRTNSATEDENQNHHYFILSKT